jgi:hypothetical protein
LKLKYLLLSAILGSSVNANAALINFFETQFNTNYASAGVGGLRGNGFGDVALSGVSGTVNKAYLYWHGPTNSTDPTFNANITFNGTAISGANIGFSDNNFWGQLNSQAYRADVTSLVSGNGTYSLAGLSPNNSNGASLVVLFDDGDNSNNFDVVTFDGNDANFSNAFDPDGWNVTLNNINYSSGLALLSMTVSDGQSFADGDFYLNGNLLGKDLFTGLSVPQTPGSRVSNGGLWDIVQIDITSFLSPGINKLQLTHSAVYDALSAIHFAVLLPVGSAPDQPDVVVSQVNAPATLMLFGTGLLFLFNRRRG